jgi:putative transposase
VPEAQHFGSDLLSMEEEILRDEHRGHPRAQGTSNREREAEEIASRYNARECSSQGHQLKKMVTPEERKEVVLYLKQHWKFSLRRASKLMGLPRSIFWYRRRGDRNVALRQELLELAGKYPSAGCPMLYSMLRRKGFEVNHKRVERLYCEEKLALKRRRARKKLIVEREMRGKAKEINECWSMDFVHDATWRGRKLRFLTVVDDASRFCPKLRSGKSLSSVDVTESLDEAIAEHGKPKRIRVDNGSEFRSNHFLRWAFVNKIQVQFIQPGKPTQNALIESFNGRFRAECLNQQWFDSLEDADEKVQKWRNFYNEDRPHGSLGGIPPRDWVLAHYENQVVNC